MTNNYRYKKTLLYKKTLWIYPTDIKPIETPILFYQHYCRNAMT